MDSSQIGLGIERKVGYSLVGLLAGDLAMVFLFSLVTKSWQQDPAYLLGTLPFYVNCSLFGWLAIGVPAVLLTNTDYIAKLKWFLVPLIGASFGSIALLTIFLIIGHLPAEKLGFAYYWMFAAVVSGIAFIVYCALVRRAVQRQNERRDLIIEAPLDIFKSPADAAKTEPPLDIFRTAPAVSAAKPEPPLDIFRTAPSVDVFKSEAPLDIYKSKLNTSAPTDPRRSTRK